MMGEITIRSGLDGMIVNAGVERYKQLNSRHLIPEAHGKFSDDGVHLTMKTIQSDICYYTSDAQSFLSWT